MNLTPAEARHLIHILVDYMAAKPNEYLESTVDVISKTEITTQDLMFKLTSCATTMENTGSAYNIRKPEIESILRKLGGIIASSIPDGWGFTLQLFTFGDKGSLFYISNAEREDIIKVMKEFIERNRQ